MAAAFGHRDPTLLLYSSFFLLLFSAIHHLPISQAQLPAPAPPPPVKLSPQDNCTGVFLSYLHTGRQRIPPVRPDTPPRQPYAFKATATVLNAADVPFPDWSLHIGFPNGTVLVSASSSALTDGSELPYIVGQNGTVGASFSGYPNTDLKTAIETAGDLTQIQAQIDFTGTSFGTAAPLLPTTISLDNPEFICPAPTSPFNTTTNTTNYMYTCCVRDPKFKPNTTSPISTRFLPRRTGDLSISYDVIQSYESSYIALVKIDNLNPLGRLDNWRLRWQWKRGEFILKTQGAYTTVVDSTECIFGPQGQYYKALDFSTVLNCQSNPTFLDLPLTMTNDTRLGMIPYCCRNGTILPTTMDPKRSSSAFQLQVFKMPPDLNRTVLYPPTSFTITGSSGALNPTYQCGPPVRVSPTLFPDPAGLPTSSSAVASWQVICNITRPAGQKPRCCVSFSGFYNDTVVPCKTCACNCGGNVQRTCSASAPALLLPPEALLVPFENRTAKALAWAAIKHYRVPNPLPCTDGCGVSINWHVLTDYRNGWSARVTLFNWQDVDIPDWFTAVVMKKAYDGYDNVYSFNGTQIGNDTIFMEGLPGLNYLMRENLPTDSSAMRDPGKSQTVISFTKKLTPGINIVGGDGFPDKVFFNGEECSLPGVLPLSGGHRTSVSALGRALMTMGLVLVVTALLLVEL